MLTVVITVGLDVKPDVLALTLGECRKYSGDSDGYYFVVVDLHNSDEIKGVAEACGITKLVYLPINLVSLTDSEGNPLTPGVVAKNLGASFAPGGRILFLDGNCVPLKECLYTHRYLASCILAGAVGYQSLADKHEDTTPFGLPKDPRLKLIPDRLGISYLALVNHGFSLPRLRPQYVWSENMSIPASLFKAVGGFWEGGMECNCGFEISNRCAVMLPDICDLSFGASVALIGRRRKRLTRSGRGQAALDFAGHIPLKNSCLSWSDEGSISPEWFSEAYFKLHGNRS